MPSMISIAAISSNLSTDDSSLIRRKLPDSPRICCFIPINAASIFGVTASCILTLSVYIYAMIQITKTDDPTSRARQIGIISIAETLILLFAALFIWGIFGHRHRLIVPFASISTFFLFALAGVCIFSIVTTANEWDDEVKKVSSDSSAITDILLFRLVLAFVAIFQAILVFCYIRSYLYIRHLRRLSEQ
ncbi:unnamed protein product [Auanema sp. JU1783]|nr:unnamed protein product [Auanema sp. JU1783]